MTTSPAADTSPHTTLIVDDTPANLGVLDWLLEDDLLEIEGVSATSTGAMNAAAVSAYGLLKGDANSARQMLHDLWHAVAKSAESTCGES